LAVPAAFAAGQEYSPPRQEQAAPPPMSSQPLLYPLPAARAEPSPCPPPPRKHLHHKRSTHHHPSKPAGPQVSDADLPPVLNPPAHSVHLDPVLGKGLWLTTWADTHLDVDAVVEQARAAGLKQLWVRTGGTRQGWYGAPLLSALLPVAHRAGIAVIAWDFPFLSDPVADSARAVAALSGVFGGERLDGFSPDIETRAEGTYNSAERVAVYLSRVRLAAGDRPVVATVMRPTPEQLKTYPYRAEAPYVDAFAPMDYWSCHEPGDVAAESIAQLAQLRPVAPIGQAYDMGPEGGRPGSPTGEEIWRFLDSAQSAGAVGASIYDDETATGEERQALARYPWGRRQVPIAATASPVPSARP
jgi:hypothetical protein